MPGKELLYCISGLSELYSKRYGDFKAAFNWAWGKGKTKPRCKGICSQLFTSAVPLGFLLRSQVLSVFVPIADNLQLYTFDYIL